MEWRLGEHYSGQLRHERAQARAEWVIDPFLEPRTLNLKTNERALAADNRRKRFLDHPEGTPVKLATATRLRQETTLPVREIGERLDMGSRKSPSNKVYVAGNAKPKPNGGRALSRRKVTF